MELDIKVERITPKMAAEMLKTNTENRTIRSQHVNAIMRDMQTNNFKMNGDAVRFADDGTLLDGQHRLRAVQLSGKAVDMLVVRGLPKEVRHTIDTGARRTAADSLRLAGYKYASSAAAIARYMSQMKNPGFQQNHECTTSEVLDMMDAYPQIEDMAAEVYPGDPSFRNHVGAVAMVARTVDWHDEDIIGAFVYHWTKGYGEEGNPCLYFRNHLLKAKLTGHTIRPVTKLRMVTWSLERFAKGETQKSTRIPDNISIPNWTRS
jgi:hypothetical protein